MPDANTTIVNYDYSKFINQPNEIGMSNGSSMNDIGDNIAGLLSYIKILVNGGGKANKTNAPLGPKFFFQTPTNCKDISDNKLKPRSVYLNYVPTGTIPVMLPNVPGIDSNYTGFLPGILENIGQINPLQIMSNIMTDKGNACMNLKMETVNEKNESKPGSGFVTINDIRRMDPKWFSTAYPKPHLPPIEQKTEGFNNCGSSRNVFSSVSDVNFDTANNKIPSIYFNLLSLIGIYIVLKIMLGGRIH